MLPPRPLVTATVVAPHEEPLDVSTVPVARLIVPWLRSVAVGPVAPLCTALPLICISPLLVTLPANPPPPLAAGVTVSDPAFVSVLARTSTAGAPAGPPKHPATGQSRLIAPCAPFTMPFVATRFVFADWPKMLRVCTPAVPFIVREFTVTPEAMVTVKVVVPPITASQAELGLPALQLPLLLKSPSPARPFQVVVPLTHAAADAGGGTASPAMATRSSAASSP